MSLKQNGKETNLANINNKLNPSKFDMMLQNASELRSSTATLQTNPNQISNMSVKWSNMVKKSKQEVLKLDLSQSIVLNSTNQLDFSMMSESMEDLNEIIEENYHLVITEDSFLRQEFHSILPFLFLSSREIHRMCLSDYEIKIFNKSIKNKIKNNRLDWMDYYKKGLIKFYQSKYFDSYVNFKAAYNMANKDKEVAKWLAFNILIIIFCTNKSDNVNDSTKDISGSLSGNQEKKNTHNSNNINLNYYVYGSFKIDFSNFDKININNEDYDYPRNGNISENTNDDDDNLIFSCCNSRKSKFKSITVNSLVNTYQSDKDKFKYNKHLLSKDLENILNTLLADKSFLENIDSENYGKYTSFYIEIMWILILISSYVKLKPDQKIFLKYQDPKYYVKKIKDKDVYLGYLAYAEYNSLINKSFNPENILVEIIYKYPKRIEAYLKFWNTLIKSEPKNYKKAHSLSEVFWKNSSIIQFDNDVY